MGALALHVFCLLFFQNLARSLLWEASIAQWQSTGLVNQGSRVQSSLEALACMTFNLCFLNSTSWLKKASVGGNSVWNRDQILIVHTALQPLQKPKFTHSETWTRNLRFRRPTPYPLGHAGSVALIFRPLKSWKCGIHYVEMAAKSLWYNVPGLEGLVPLFLMQMQQGSVAQW